MRAIHITAHGGTDVLAVRELPIPVPQPGEVLVAVVASSLNPVDGKVRDGFLPQTLPATLGNDISGVVVDGGGAFRPGDRVVGLTAQYRNPLRGSWAELVAVPAGQLAAAPTSVPLVEAAALPLAALTAHQALRSAGLRPGERLLVTGATGGVGRFGVQLGRSLGATVDALVRRPAAVATARDLGAGAVFTAPADVPGETYDVVLDTTGLDVGGAVRPGGRLRSIVEAFERPGIDPQMFYVSADGDDLAHLVGLLDKGELRLGVAARYPLAEVAAASELFERGGLDGKVLLLT
jgi:NADPH:quinone reductase-like Zn-dependent oxidoreductase